MTSPTKREQELGEEIAKETYFDLTTHPSEAGPKGSALLNEYLTKLEPRIAQALADYRTTLQTEMLECVPERLIGDRTHCQTCGGHVAAGECDCLGWNKCRNALITYAKEQGVEMTNPKDNEEGYEEA